MLAYYLRIFSDRIDLWHFGRLIESVYECNYNIDGRKIQEPPMQCRVVFQMYMVCDAYLNAQIFHSELTFSCTTKRSTFKCSRIIARHSARCYQRL